MENNTFPREITLCLSGGAARGAFHLGVISVLEESCVSIKAISGTSIGALIGGALACGKTSHEILEVFKSQAFRDIFIFHPRINHMFRLDSDAPIIRKMIDKDSFEDLKIPLIVAVCNINDENIQYVKSGENFRKIVLASCSIVPLFEAVTVDDMLLVDGGLVDNFPVQELKRFNYPILGINLYPKYNKRPKSIFSWLKKIIYVAWQAHNLKKNEFCDIYICSDAINELRVFSFKDIDKAYELGRKEMQKQLNLH